MRVLFVGSFRQGLGGSLDIEISICRAVLSADKSIQTEFLNSKTLRSFDYSETFCLFRKLLRLWSILCRVNKIIREFEPDVIHMNGCWELHFLFVFILSRLRRSLIVITPHGMLTKEAMRSKAIKKSCCWWIYQRWMCVAADVIQVTSDNEQADLRSLISSTRTINVPLPYFSDKESVAVNESLSAFGGTIESDEKRDTIVFIGRIAPIKGLLEVITAWALVKPQGWRLVIYGPVVDLAYYERLVKIIDCNNLHTDVILRGPVRGEIKSRVLQSAKFFILPSQSENFGLIVCEAWSHDLPIIFSTKTRWAEYSELSRFKVKPLIVDWVVFLEHRLNKITKEEAIEQINFGRRLLNSEFDPEIVGHRLCKIYEYCYKAV